MPNQITVEIYIKKADVESILSDEAVTHVLVRGTVDITSGNISDWQIKATGYPTSEAMDKTTCPHPC